MFIGLEYSLAFGAGFFIAGILTNIFKKPKVELKLLKIRIRLHHLYYGAILAFISMLLDHFSLAFGLIGVSIHDFYLHFKERSNRKSAES